MSKYKLKKSKCRLNIDNILEDLSDIYNDEYLNDYLFLHAILMSKHVNYIDDYIRDIKDIYTTNTFLKFAITGTLRSNTDEDIELYTNEFTMSSNFDVKKGYFVFMKEIIIYNAADDKFDPDPFVTEYESILFRLHSGARYIIKMDGEIYKVNDYSEIIEDQSQYNDYTYLGSTHHIDFNNIENYVQLFMRLYRILGLKSKQDCPSFIQLLEDFRDDLNMDWDKYHKFDDPDMLQLVLDIIADQTAERGVLSIIRRLNVESSLMSEYERNIVEPKTLDDFIDIIYKAILNLDFKSKHEDYGDIVLQIIDNMSILNNVDHFILISVVIKQLIEYSIVTNPRLHPLNLPIGAFGLYSDHMDEKVVIFISLTKKIINDDYTFDKFIEDITTKDYTKYYIDILHVWDHIEIYSIIVRDEIHRSQAMRLVYIDPNEINNIIIIRNENDKNIEKLEFKITKTQIRSDLISELEKLEEDQQMYEFKIQRLQNLNYQYTIKTRFTRLSNNLQSITTNIRQIQDLRISNTNDNEALSNQLQTLQHESNITQNLINNTENAMASRPDDAILLTTLQQLQQEYDQLQIRLEETGDLITANTNSNEELLTILQPLEHESNQIQIQIGGLENILTIQYHDKYRYMKIIDTIIEFMLSYVSKFGSRDVPHSVIGYLFDILYTFIKPELQPDGLREELNLYIRTKLTEKLEEINALGFIYNSDFEPIEIKLIVDRNLHPFNIKMGEIFDALESDRKTYNRSNEEIFTDFKILSDFIFSDILDPETYLNTDMKNIIIHFVAYNTPIENLIILAIYDKYRSKTQSTFKLTKYNIMNTSKHIRVNDEWQQFNFRIQMIINNTNIFNPDYNFWIMLDIIIETQGYNNLMKFVGHMVDITIYYLRNADDFFNKNEYDILYTFDMDVYENIGNNHMFLYGNATFTYILKIIEYMIDSVNNSYFIPIFSHIIEYFKEILKHPLMQTYLKNNPIKDQEIIHAFNMYQEIVDTQNLEFIGFFNDLVNIYDLLDMHKFMVTEEHSNIYSNIDVEIIEHGIYTTKEEYLDYFGPLLDQLEYNENSGNIEINIIFLGYLMEPMIMLYELDRYHNEVLKHSQYIGDYVYNFRNIREHGESLYEREYTIISYIIEYYRHKNIKIMDVLRYIDTYNDIIKQTYFAHFYKLILEYGSLMYDDYIDVIPDTEDIQSEQDMVLWLNFAKHLKLNNFHGKPLDEEIDFSDLILMDFQRMFPEYKNLIKANYDRWGW